MEDVQFWYIPILFIVTVVFTVFFHELGHALPVLLLPGGKVTIFIGSFGDKKYSLRIKVFNLEMWFRYDPLKWRGGLCKPGKEDMSINEILLMLASGPFFTLIQTLVSLYLFLYMEPAGWLKVMLFMFIFEGAITFIYNIIPRKLNAIVNGRQQVTDGQSILTFIRLKKYPKEFVPLMHLCNKGAFKEAAENAAALINGGLNNEHISRIRIEAYLQDKDFESAHACIAHFENHFTPTADDLYHFAYIHMKLQLDGAVAYAKRALSINPRHHHSFNLLGYQLNTQGKYQEAIPYFVRALSIVQDGYAWANLGHAKIETGLLEEGFHDINKGIRLNDTNSYAYRNLGIYFLKKERPQDALDYFLKAKKVEEETDQIQWYIEQAEQQLAKTTPAV